MSLHPDRGFTSARVFETSGTGFTTLPESPIDATHSGWVIETQQPLIVPDTAAETRWPEAMAEVQTAMLGGVPSTVLREAILAHPTMAEGLNALFAAVPGR